jgi:hypothetical protein
MVRRRRNGMAYTVSALKAIEACNVPPDVQARVQRLKEQTDRLDSKFEKLATRLNEKLGD